MGKGTWRARALRYLASLPALLLGSERQLVGIEKHLKQFPSWLAQLANEHFAKLFVGE
jgi:hypothetical protein